MKSVFAGSGAPPFMKALKRVEAALKRKYGLSGRLPEIARVLSVDPGKITGVAVFWVWRKSGKTIAWAETLITHDEDQQVWDLLAFVRELSGHGMVDIVVESFIVHSVKKDEDFLSPVRIGRSFRWGVMERMPGSPAAFEGVMLWWGDVHIWMVPPSEMSSMDDARLKHLGHFTPGPDHRRDATRHALLHLKRVRKFLQDYKDVGDAIRKGDVSPVTKRLEVMRKLTGQKRAAAHDLEHWFYQNNAYSTAKVVQKSAARGGKSGSIGVRIGVG